MTQRLIEMVPYNTAWPVQFQTEAALVKKALGGPERLSKSSGKYAVRKNIT